jgi:CheY-like chemotaxis protein
VTNPVPKTDTVFLKHFAMLIGFLVVVAILLGALSVLIYDRNPPPQNPDKQKIVEQRIAPVGAVYAGDTGRAAMAAAAEAAARAAAADGNAAWAVIQQHQPAVALLDVDMPGRTGLELARAIKSDPHLAGVHVTGSTGVMPPKGGNPALNDEQMRATVEWMVEQVR